MNARIMMGLLLATVAMAQTAPPGVPAPKVGNNATVPATKAALQRSRQDATAVERGSSMYAANCAFCHGKTAKGTDIGPDLVRSVVAQDDDKGELVAKAVRTGHTNKAAMNASLTDSQLADIAAWLHVQIYGAANRSTYEFLNIVTGDAKKGEAYFNGAGKCNTCHSVTGDLKGIGATADGVTLQGMWISGGGGGRGGGGRGRGGAGAGGGGGSTVWDNSPPVIDKATTTITVTLANGQKINGVAISNDDFHLAMKDMTGAYHSWTKVNDFPKVETHNPLEPHGLIARSLTDEIMHNVTAYLATLK